MSAVNFCDLRVTQKHNTCPCFPKSSVDITMKYLNVSFRVDLNEDVHLATGITLSASTVTVQLIITDAAPLSTF